jgi:IMP dehydrogenase
MIEDLFVSDKIIDAICFDDVLLVPQYSTIHSRKEIDLSLEVVNTNQRLSLPIISSPMDTVTECEMAHEMSLAGGLGIIHRYNTIDEQVKILAESIKAGVKIPAASVGVSGDFLKRARSLVRAGADIICVDIAHGHHILMKEALSALRADPYIKDVHIMAGNVATLHAFNDLADWGADSIRVGIGGGSICSTRIQTGHGMPTLQSVIDCAKSDRDALLIADGGLRTSGDIVKAIAAGADMVMLGSLLSGTDESPGDIMHMPTEDRRFKSYRGMASVEAQVDWRGHASSIEGVSTTVDCKGPVSTVLHTLEKGLRSGLSYSGAKNILEFRSRSTFIKQSSSGAVESSTHILKS